MTTNTPPAPHIRPYRSSDAAAVRECIAELQDAERAIDGRLRPGSEMAAEYLEAILENCRRYAGEVLVLDLDGAVAGFACVLGRVPFERLDEPPGEYALVSDLVVRREHRRRGYARLLLTQAEHHAASHDAAELRIGVLSDNAPARTLYLDMGFTPYLETLAKSLRA